MTADLSKPAERVKLHGFASDADILVNNAGAIPSGGIAGISEQALGDANRWSEMTKSLHFDRPVEPREIADMAVFGASQRGGSLNGTDIDIDGAGQFEG